MTDTNLADLLERAVSRAPVGPPPIERMIARSSSRRRRRSVLVGGSCAAAAAVVLATVTLQLPGGEQGAPQSAGSPSQSSTALTPKQYATAVRLARQQIRETGATVTSATVSLSRGTVAKSENGHPCHSGRLMTIKLFGTFPHTPASGYALPPGIRDATGSAAVHALVVTADPRYGIACVISAKTASAAPEPGAVTLRLH